MNTIAGYLLSNERMQFCQDMCKKLFLGEKLQI